MSVGVCELSVWVSRKFVWLYAVCEAVLMVWLFIRSLWFLNVRICIRMFELSVWMSRQSINFKRGHSRVIDFANLEFGIAKF